MTVPSAPPAGRRTDPAGRFRPELNLFRRMRYDMGKRYVRDGREDMTIVEELRTDRESGARRLEAEYKAELMALARRFCADEGDAEELVNRTFAAVVEGIDD